MFTPLEKRSAALEHRLLDMNTAICDMYKYKSEEDEMMELTVLEDGTTMIPSSGEEEEKGDGGSRNDVLWTPVGLPKQNKVVCVGRICNEVYVFLFYPFMHLILKVLIIFTLLNHCILSFPMFVRSLSF